MASKSQYKKNERFNRGKKESKDSIPEISNNIDMEKMRSLRKNIQ